jgi:signal transduction histidine kinase
MRRLARMLPYWAVGTSMALTAGALLGLGRIGAERDDARFGNATEVVKDSLSGRLDAYLAVLLAARSLFISRRGDIDRATFERFVAGLHLRERYPGIQGVGFSRRLEPSEIERVVGTLRAEGLESFRLWPDEAGAERHAIVYLEPLDRRNLAALGYDMFTEAVRREAMSRARDSGEPACSGRVTLVQEIDPRKQAGFLIYVPVYREGAEPADVETRRESLLGFVFSPFRVEDLVTGIFGSQREPRVAFDLYDAATLEPARLIYRGIDPAGGPPLRSAVVALSVAGRPWTLHVASTPAFEVASTRRFFPYLIPVAVLINGALLLATRAQLRARAEEAVARARLATLAEASRRFSEAQLDVRHVARAVREEIERLLGDPCVIDLATGDATGDTVAPGDLALVAPLRVGERVIGTATVTRARGRRPYTIADRHLLQDLADRAAFAIENARLADRLRASTAEAQQAVRVRDEFVAVAGHELRTPLTALQLQLESLLRRAQKGAEPDRLVERLTKAQAHVGRLDHLIAGLLDVSRITAGRLELHLEELELGALVAEVVDRFGEQLRSARCELITLEAGAPVTGRWDRARLDQVLTNLLGNAIKYGAGAPVRVEVRRVQDRATVAVHDAGIGISPDDLARVFGRFERAVSDRNYGGLGLGLWISRQIVEAHRGRIRVESELGAGSTFTVELPLG